MAAPVTAPMTLGFSASTASILDLEHAFRLAEELALDFVELSADRYELAPHTQHPEAVRDLSRISGIGVTLHLPFVDLNLASLVPCARKLAVERVVRALDYGAAIGARYGVLHTGQNPFYHPGAQDDAHAALTASLTELAHPAILVLLENQATCSRELIQGPDALRALSEQSGFDACLDLGHAHIEAQHTGDPTLIARYLATLNGTLRHLHLHGNDGISDQHRPTDEGTVPLAQHTGFLQGFAGGVCLEVAGGIEAVARSVRHVRALVMAP